MHDIMKLLNNIAGIFLTIPLLVTACQKEPDKAEPVDPVDLVEVSFSARINDMATRVDDSEFETGDKISVFACHEAVLSSSNYAQNVRYSFSEDLFKAKSPVTYPANASLTFYAVYPYGNYSVPELRFSVEKDQSDFASYMESDLMTSSVKAKDKEIVELNFSHRLAKLVLKLNDTASKDKSVTFMDVYTSLDADIADNIYEKTGRKSDVIAYDDGSDGFKAILPPQKITAGTLLAEISVGNEVFEWVTDSDIELASGVEYVYTAALKGKVVTISADINSWNDSDETHVDADRNK